jgi:hypothetical protein
MAFDPDHCKRVIGALSEAIALLEPYDGKQIKRLSEANQSKFRDTLAKAFDLDKGNGNFRSTFFLDPNSRVYACGLGQARAELERMKVLLAAYEAHAADPLVAKIRDLVTELKATHKAISDTHGAEAYNQLCRLGMLGNVVFTC